MSTCCFPAVVADITANTRQYGGGWFAAKHCPFVKVKEKKARKPGKWMLLVTCCGWLLPSFHVASWPRTSQNPGISQLMLQSCDSPTNMLTDFNLVVGFWFCENKYFHRRKVLPMKYRSPQDRATGRHRCWWVKHSSRQDFNQNCQNNQSSAFQSYSNRQVQLGQCFGGTSPQLPGGRIFSRLFPGAFSNSWPSP